MIRVADGQEAGGRGPATAPVPGAGGGRGVERLEAELAYHRELVVGSLARLIAIDRTPGWRLLVGCHWLSRKVLPVGSLRRRWLKGLVGSVGGLVGAGAALYRGWAARGDSGYARWRAKHEPGPAALKAQERERFPDEPRITLLVAVPAGGGRGLAGTLRSVLRQTYARWELCLAVPPAGESELRALLGEVAAGDARCRVLPVPAGEGPAAALGRALAAAEGEFVAVLGPEDLLAPAALFEVVRALNRQPEADLIYSDEDALSPAGKRRCPLFKPDWSPETLRGHNYVGDLCVFRRALVERVGGFRPAFEGCLAYDLVLRASEQARAVVHVPKVLYHRARLAAGPDAGAAGGREALRQHLGRLGLVGRVEDGPQPRTYRVRYAVPQRPLVSLIIPTRDHPDVLARCVDSLAGSSYPHYEVLVVENGSTLPETFAYYRELAGRPGVRVLTWDRPFNYAALNNDAAAQARGEVLLFLNNDMEVIDPDWLEGMLGHALRREVGAVGAKLYYPDDTIQHAGVVVGNGDGPLHLLRFLPRGAAGYGNRLVCTHNVSAVTGACLMMRRQVFEEVGGFDPAFATAFNDVDLCLKVREKGYWVLWTPDAELYHYESTTRGLDRTPEQLGLCLYEMSLFQWKWGAVLDRGDPYFTPNLRVSREDGSLTF